MLVPCNIKASAQAPFARIWHIHFQLMGAPGLQVTSFTALCIDHDRGFGGPGGGGKASRSYCG